jgi:osomolarity two-component system sensor histidine kinase SLN1
MLTASLKSAQLSSSLLLMQILVKQATMRLVPQAALELYYKEGNSTDEQWDRTAEDYDAIFAGDENSRIAVQARIYHKEGPDRVLFSRTASRVTNVTLPYERPNGQLARMGDHLYGYIPELYPRFKVRAINRSLDKYDAEYQGRAISRTNFLLSGPYRISNHLTLISITMPIVNNVSDTRTIGWLTIALDAQLIKDVIDAKEGLGESGLTLLFGPHNVTNSFPAGYLFDSPNANAPQNVEVRYKVPPTERKDNRRHIRYDTSPNPPPLDWAQFPAVRNCFTRATGNRNNAGNMISTRNEEHRRVAVGYAIVNSSMVDWMVMVEYLQPEVWKPINRLRNIILACVFGSMLAILLVTLPVAHYFIEPIRRLRDATGKTVLHYSFERATLSNQGDSENQTSKEVIARDIGFFRQLFHCRKSRAAYRADKQKRVIRERPFRIPDEVKDRKHLVHDELTDLTTTFNVMTNELVRQYESLDEKVRQRTAELELSKNAAEAANESKTLFIANISHELKTPLNGILGMCAVCMSEDDPLKLKQSLSIIYKSGNLLLKLLTDLLTFRQGVHRSIRAKEANDQQ